MIEIAPPNQLRAHNDRTTVNTKMPGSKIIGVGTVKGDPKISIGSWVMIVVVLALLLLPLLTLGIAFICAQKAEAQAESYWYYWTAAAQQSAAKNDEKAQVKMLLDNVSEQLFKYYDKNKSLPRFEPEMDKFMTGSYKSILRQDADSTWAPSASGSQRSYGSLRMFYDAGAGNLTKINDKYKLPSGWSGDSGSLVVVTDGGSNAVAFYAGVDQKPTAFSVIDCTPGDDDDDEKDKDASNKGKSRD